MMCCQVCPFAEGSSSLAALSLPATWRNRCSPSRCVREQRLEAKMCPDMCQRLRWRCPQDLFVVHYLFHDLPLAQRLASHTLDTAALSRDGQLLLALLQAAQPVQRAELSERLRERWPHALGLLDTALGRLGGVTIDRRSLANPALAARALDLPAPPARKDTAALAARCLPRWHPAHVLPLFGATQ